ncbi:serine hydrolase domain-containing protein [Herbiconiux ginsengi]|uniref:CubicO group peptidase, beta-lactamase class C family n=1 Tax=Herbiconiux ginsengi TaxID=381665 RepID=A0A1H3MQC9_9MICO|nr:serine hydrolase domain-containing protein [Herbiconiux ginsengi]SDY78693.1 CubicO group peptidase, beta-lactamase class C family [Herbiconiux ginsengi]
MGTLVLDDAVRWVKRQVEEGPLPSAVFGVATSAGVQHMEAFTGRDARTAEIDDYYALFSVTKPLSGIAIARSVERGELSLRASLASAFPSDEAQPWRAGVRLEHLISHTAGLSEPPLDSPLDLDEQLGLARPDFLPGSMVRYSNIAFHGAARILTAVTGRDLHDEIEVLGAFAGGSALTFDAGSDPHEVFGQKGVGLDHAAMVRHRHPAAGVNATAAGLLELGSSLLRANGGVRGQVLHPETLRGMLVPRTIGVPEPIPGDPKRDFGLAWNIRQTSTALLHRNAFGHEGWSGTQWWIYPELDLCFALMTNLLDVRLYGVDPDELNNAVVAGS